LLFAEIVVDAIHAALASTGGPGLAAPVHCHRASLRTAALDGSCSPVGPVIRGPGSTR
jgi:hypothetical protein